MKLVHYSHYHVSGISNPHHPQKTSFKPQGFWVSDETDSENSWSAWCKAENFRLERLTHVHDITLNPSANILVLSGENDLDNFHASYSQIPSWCRELNSRLHAIDWLTVSEKYQGIVITPYVRSRRISGWASNWYYGWDCASGCIWDPTAVQGITLRVVLDILEVRGDHAMPGYPSMLASRDYDWP